VELRTLILTPSMSPHRIATWEQAVVYLFEGTAEVIESYEATVSSPSITIEVPAVMRLVKPVRSTKNQVRFSRSNVYARDGYRCCYCGEKKKPRDLNYDHVVPRHQGGHTTWLNIVSACFVCNGRKRNRTPEQAGMRMHFRPYVPQTLPMGAPFLIDPEKAPAQWLPYLGAMGQAVSA